MTEADAVALAEDKGLQDGAACAPYSPPLRWQISEDADDAYTASYFHALAYCAPLFDPR